MIVDRIHFSIFTKITGQKQQLKRLQKIIIAKKQESKNVFDWATSIICFAFTFWNVFNVLWMKFTLKEVLLVGSWLSKKVGLFFKNAWNFFLGILKNKSFVPQISSLNSCLPCSLIGKSILSMIIGTKLRLLDSNLGFVKLIFPVATILLFLHCIMFVLLVEEK